MESSPNPLCWNTQYVIRPSPPLKNSTARKFTSREHGESPMWNELILDAVGVNHPEGHSNREQVVVCRSELKMA